MATTRDSRPKSVGQVLTAGHVLFSAGFGVVFPWVLAAELLALLPFAPTGGIFDTDLSLLADPGYLGRVLLLGVMQAFLYAIAVRRMAVLAGDAAPGAGLWPVLRVIPATVIGYICYELIVIIGLLFTFAFFMLGAFIIGPLAGVVLCVLPLAPTAAASTALALFVFPAVLEGRGPFAALGESSRLAKTAWVKVSLVISVPAVALLAAAVVTDMGGLMHGVSAGLDALRSSGDGGISMDQAGSLLSGFKVPVSNGGYDSWRIAGTLLSGVAWWYTLAVCYVQYRDLKDQPAA
ncbi:MAG TPA: hypothetical protein VH327_02620 [Gammaproteobacteria bacterium]|nr:hypothetical protein [Gammaproteobacteria bacterium]